jgi:hypothetical protein
MGSLSSFSLLLSLTQNSKNCKKVSREALLPTICSDVLLYFASLSVEVTNIRNMKGGRIRFPWYNLSTDSFVFDLPFSKLNVIRYKSCELSHVHLSLKKSYVKNVLRTILPSERKIPKQMSLFSKLVILSIETKVLKLVIMDGRKKFIKI